MSAAVASSVAATLIIVMGIATLSSYIVIENGNRQTSSQYQLQTVTVTTTVTATPTNLDSVTQTTTRVVTDSTTTTLVVTEKSTTTQVTTVSDSFAPVELISATLYGGVTASPSVAATSSLTFSLESPNSVDVVSGLYLSGSGISAITGWDGASSQSSSPNLYLTQSGSYAFPPGQVASFTFYPWSNPSQSILTGQTFNYIIYFSDGEVVSGSLIAQ